MPGDRLGRWFAKLELIWLNGIRLFTGCFFHMNEVDYQSTMNVIVKRSVWVGGWVLSVFVIFIGDLWASIYFFEA
jgi:hypothetical protein